MLALDMYRCIPYGTLPTREEFGTAFKRFCPEGVYVIDDPETGREDLTEETAWKAVIDGVNKFRETGDSCETDFAGALLYLLGIEWT